MTDFLPLTKGKLVWIKDSDDWFYLQDCLPISEEECSIFFKDDVRSAVELLRHYLKHSALYHKSGNHIIDVAIDEAFPVFIKESNEEDKK